MAKFLTDPHGFNPATTLFTIQGGGNDIFAANTLGLTGLAMFGVVDQATTHLQNSIATLAAAGARRILWMTLPDLGLTPLSQAGGAGAMAAGSGLTDLFNTILAAKVAGVDAFFAGLSVDLDLIGVDTADFMRDAFANPTLSMTAPPCTFIPLAFPDCDGLFFHDGVHPTTAAHQQFANVLFRAVPEPQSLALVLLALGALVAGQRRRRQPAALQSA